ncbi:hypothetical protein [Asanoa siamensis]|uniref:Uncharacterized protein n=1 Tax=Asanoa siamensis TaxID=926357 RepID=A0ABQ4CVI5_9ACTN|nr:hypothetical protein [Asanoa siamensis]GIF75297.1 hypothetical protein Asi02nite_48150 [Asanoa siamensis]
MVARSLVFYQWRSEPLREAFSPAETATHLAAEAVNDPDFLVLKGKEVTTAVNVIDPGGKNRPTRLQLLALRTEDQHPAQWQPGGKLNLLPVLKGHYPADVSHVTLWPDGIAGQDLHKNAPRPGRLSFFLRNKLREYVSFDPLYDPDMFEKLLRMRGGLRSVEIGITKPEYATREDAGVLETFMPRAFGPKAPSLRVRVGIGKYGPRDTYLERPLEDAAFEAAENAHDIVDALIISGFDPLVGKVETINLLKQRLKVEVDLPRDEDAPALPNADATFSALDSAHRRYTDEELFRRALRTQVMQGD